jgi:hypothetical protein
MLPLPEVGPKAIPNPKCFFDPPSENSAGIESPKYLPREDVFTVFASNFLGVFWLRGFPTNSGITREEFYVILPVLFHFDHGCRP